MQPYRLAPFDFLMIKPEVVGQHQNLSLRCLFQMKQGFARVMMNKINIKAETEDINHA